MIGRGYQSCKPCHYDSSGGGPLTDYGRTAAEEILSTLSRSGEGESLYGLIDIKPFGISGDFRNLFHRYEDDQVRITQHFPMQRELSLTLDPSQNVSFVGSAGLYGPDAKEYEYRRYYGKITFGKSGFGLRGGRFMPAFGIQIPDHTKGIRQLFGEGRESLNLEGSYTGRYLEFFITRIAGGNSGIETSSKPIVNQRDDRNGYSSKLSFFLRKGIQIGGSYTSLTDDETAIRNYVAYHAFMGDARMWVFGEYQSGPELDSTFYGVLGVQPIKGLWLKGEVDKRSKSEASIFGTIDFFPRPHFELTLSASRDEGFFIAHFYL